MDEFTTEKTFTDLNNLITCHEVHSGLSFADAEDWRQDAAAIHEQHDSGGDWFEHGYALYGTLHERVENGLVPPFQPTMEKEGGGFVLGPDGLPLVQEGGNQELLNAERRFLHNQDWSIYAINEGHLPYTPEIQCKPPGGMV